MTSPNVRVSRSAALSTVVGLVLLALNLRAAISGVSPLLDELQHAFGLSGAAMGVLTTLPVLCLGAFAAVAPPLGRKWGTEKALAGALLLIGLGILIRLAPGAGAVPLFVGTAVAGAGIAIGNVLMPYVIKSTFPHRVGLFTGLAMMLMSTGAALSSGLAVPLDDLGGWRTALAVWSIPAFLAAAVWAPMALRTRRLAASQNPPAPTPPESPTPTASTPAYPEAPNPEAPQATSAARSSRGPGGVGASMAGAPQAADAEAAKPTAARVDGGDQVAEAGRGVARGGDAVGVEGMRAAEKAGAGRSAEGEDGGSLVRNRLAWYVTLFMGMQSLAFYVLMSWLPAIMRDHGYPATTAGLMLSVMMLLGIPSGLVMPVLAARREDQRPLVVAVMALMGVGVAGLELAPGAGWLWVVVLGFGTGSAFPLAYTLITLRAATPKIAARLSGMAQTTGYLLAGAGPFLFGVLNGATHGWNVPLIVLLAWLVPETLFALRAARPTLIGRPQPATPISLTADPVLTRQPTAVALAAERPSR